MSEPAAELSRSLSILDLAFVSEGETVGDAFNNCVAVAQRAEERGYERIWYAEHHNMASIASSATSVLIAHVAANTTSIRLGAGGVMLPNHSPLVIAEQFGTLATLHPDRIDLGLGRAPGTDRNTMYAMRVDPAASDRFPQDVLELQAYLAGNSFAPTHLLEAVSIYRDRFEPSEQLAEPHVVAGVNVIAADTAEEAERQHIYVRRKRVARFLRVPRALTDEEADEVLASPQGRQIAQMMHYTAVGTTDTITAYLDDFATEAGADELMTVHPSPTITERLRSIDLLADAYERTPVAS